MQMACQLHVTRFLNYSRSKMELPDGTTFSSGGGLYIHIAYCRKKCLYCDFFSAGERIADWYRYTDALIAELKERIDEMPCPLQTIYVGGGTPSLIPLEHFNRLIDALRPFARSVKEFTIEVNPDDVCHEKLEMWKRGGVNRISIGIQSFNDQLLCIVGRRHDSKTAKEAYNLARQYFDNISIDLMFGLPGQTVDMWEKDVEEAIRLKPEHISAYSLMFEPGTALTTLRDKGRLEEIPEEASEKLFSILIDKLREAGYDHYEISNFALPGFRSRHNSSYWHQIPYLGIGPSAHSYDGKKTRRANKSDIRGYIEHWTTDHNDAFYENESLSEEELIEEYVMTRMRTKEGIILDNFKRRFGEVAYKKFIRKCNNLQDKGQLKSDGKTISLQESEILISDTIILELTDL